MHCRIQRIAFVLGLVFFWIGNVATALSQGTASCTSQPLAFRENIRQPDSWEEEWELMWPDASNVLQTWRTRQFESLLEVWKKIAPRMAQAKSQAEVYSLPKSAAFLACFVHCPQPTIASAVNIPDLNVWEQLSGVEDPKVAMSLAYRCSQSTLDLDAWAMEVRTGMRLIENLELPPVHVVSKGETLYSIGRTWNVHPKCISELNGVWDDIRPNMHLLIPQPGH